MSIEQEPMAEEPYINKPKANGTEAHYDEATELELTGTSTASEVLLSGVRDSAMNGKINTTDSAPSRADPEICTTVPHLTPKEKIELLEMRYTELLEKKIARLEAEEYESLENGTEDSEAEDEEILKLFRPKSNIEEAAKDEKEDNDNQERNMASVEGVEKTTSDTETKAKDQTSSIVNVVDTAESPVAVLSDAAKDQIVEDVERKGDQAIDKGRVRYLELELDRYGQYSEKPVEKPNNKNASEEAKDEEYAISWRFRKEEKGEKGEKNEKDAKPSLLIESHALRVALKEVGDGNSSVTFDTKVVAMHWPYELIYHKEQKLRELAENADKTTKEDIEILLREVEQRQATERKDAEKLAQNGQVTHELLWTLFYIGDLVVQKDIMGKEQVFVISPHQTRSSSDDNESYILDLCSVDYNGTNFTNLEYSAAINPFKGAKAITDLEMIPLKKYGGPDGSGSDTFEKRLVERGRKFEDLCNNQSEGSFRQYRGIIINEGVDEMLPDDDDNTHESIDSTSATARLSEPRTKDGMGKLETGSLVIIDHDGYFNYAKKSFKLGKQSPYGELCDCSLCLEVQEKFIENLPQTHSDGKKRAKLSDRQCLLCPPRVFGFDIRSKVWMQLLVDNVEDIDQKSKEEPFGKLELDDKSKNILKTLVLQHSKNMNPIDDIIPGKGDGLIVLLHGPPGVGKTLTAESLARLSGKPLFTISMTDVGTSPAVVEKNLLRVFGLATHWKALLLFDEADIFLETRSLQDLRRNSLVSVLLRILEYFRGILFLTSNRVKTFDEAFQSRINVAVRYRDLDRSQRSNIWAMWLEKASEDVHDRNEFDQELKGSDGLAGAELNGREIRNVFRSAMAMAQSRPLGQRKLTFKDVEMVLKRTVEFQSYMRQNKELAERMNIR